jgi:hypothetical protein
MGVILIDPAEDMELKRRHLFTNLLVQSMRTSYLHSKALSDDAIRGEISYAFKGVAARTTKAFGVPVVHSTINVAADREQPSLPDLADRLSTGPPPGQQEVLAIAEKWRPLPRPGDQLPVLRRLRTRRSTTGRPA